MNISALDLGKYNAVFCDYSCINGEHEFGKVKTTPHTIHDLIVEKEPQRVVLEVCTIAGWVVDIADALGKETETANTTHDAWRWKNVKKKNDREDALKLAKLSAMNQLPTVHIPDKQVGCYAGLTPRQYQSGQTDHQGKISGQGNKLLRNLLVEICWVSSRYNSWVRDTYKKLLRGSKSRKKIAITALARKLVVRCWVMLRYEQDWREDIRKNVA